MIERFGQTIMDSVEIYNCSQIDTDRAALRFVNAANKNQIISNSAIHNGLSWAVSIKSSKNILLKDNVVFNFRPVGINIGSSSNITLDGNVVGLIR